MNGLLRCFDHLRCLSVFVIFFCIIKLLVPFLFNGNLCNLFSSFEKTRSLFLFKINFVRRNYFELIFFWWALVSLLLYFFSSSGEWQLFIVLRFTFFIVMKNITVFFIILVTFCYIPAGHSRPLAWLHTLYELPS